MFVRNSVLVTSLFWLTTAPALAQEEALAATEGDGTVRTANDAAPAPSEATRKAEGVSEEADHEALRALLKKASEAINGKHFDALDELIDTDDFAATAVDNQTFTSADEFKGYLDELTGGEAPMIQDIAIEPEADGLTTFVAPGVGVNQGTSTETYTFRDGDVRTMHTRWSAVVRKGTEGWRISRLHVSANLLDNPVLGALQGSLTTAALGTGAAGLLAGFGLGFLLRRRKEHA